ncbi:hypothetical protein [Staphylococcus saprophyticus]|uniref:hypothetical protein n=1 Tax=Staphylococcus saprophyticus TaxID=29385 RepID=UPI001D179F5B|nr:hypothetical protein [Staphylococcus saprophyticus]MCC4221704.1 hypothetical protein [Staphylococcus saprophyticus]
MNDEKNHYELNNSEINKKIIYDVSTAFGYVGCSEENSGRSYGEIHNNTYSQLGLSYYPTNSSHLQVMVFYCKRRLFTEDTPYENGTVFYRYGYTFVYINRILYVLKNGQLQLDSEIFRGDENQFYYTDPKTENITLVNKSLNQKEVDEYIKIFDDNIENIFSYYYRYFGFSVFSQELYDYLSEKTKLRFDTLEKRIEKILGECQKLLYRSFENENIDNFRYIEKEEWDFMDNAEREESMLAFFEDIMSKENYLNFFLNAQDKVNLSLLFSIRENMIKTELADSIFYY